MKVKTRSLESVRRLNLSRCNGKIIGYDKRIKEIAMTMIILDSIGYLTDDILTNLFSVANNLYAERQKLIWRVSSIKAKNISNTKEIPFRPVSNYSYSLYLWFFKKNENIYKRYRSIMNEKNPRLKTIEIPDGVIIVHPQTSNSDYTIQPVYSHTTENDDYIGAPGGEYQYI